LIDWQKIEEKVDKKISIEVKVLLELKSKIDNLEQNSVQIKKEFEKIAEELKVTKSKLSGREKSLIQLTEKRSSARKTLDKIREDKLYSDIQVTKLSAKVSDLKTKLAESVEDASNLEKQLKTKAEKSEQIEGKAKKLLEKEKEMQKISLIVKQREKEIEFLKKNFEVEKGKTEYQIKRVMSIEANIARADKILKLLNRVKQSTVNKGFISDKELEQFLIEIED